MKEADAAPVMAEDVLDKVSGRYFSRRMGFLLEYGRLSSIRRF